MASMLTYLKSKLLLPKEENKESHTAEDLEAAIKYQLQRLEAMQNIAKVLYSQPLINRDVFYRGFSDGIKIKYIINYSSNLYDLLKSYSSIISKNDNHSLTIGYSELYSVEEAINRLKSIFGSFNEWTNFIHIIPKLKSSRIINKSAVSSNFVASLELAKNGFIEVMQKETFSNIFFRAKK
tara:strand:- start:826 stop:1368 length:543 start_codon:yes stop_codon:yes gene_type:complete